MKKPKRLSPGSTVAVVSPSWGGPSRYPDIYQLGCENLRTLFGLRVKEYPCARMDADVLDKNPRIRAQDINDAFTDPGVSAIIASIGGDDSVRILPFIDTDNVMHNPKILMGFSDTATLLTFFNSLGLVTFNGPSVMAGFAQAASFPSVWTEQLKAILFDGVSEVPFQPYAEWSEGYPDWHDLLSLGYVSNKQNNTQQWHWLQGESVVTGQLWGGCIEVLEGLKNTAYWPARSFWHSKILFFETSEEIPKPVQILRFLRNYGMQGIFSHINALLFGRPFGYTDEEKHDLRAVIHKVVTEEFGAASLPVVTDCDFGHTDPQWVLPLGAMVRIDCVNHRITLMESAVE
ncbi:MAG: LD-carboxypeptidase [Chitinivibrionales bacterium]|nr:LD-carboxypeptidase [Chitinivibrionales bacterium]